jgi:hypothetical protein
VKRPSGQTRCRVGLKFHADGELKKKEEKEKKKIVQREALFCASIEKMRGRLFKCTM